MTDDVFPLEPPHPLTASPDLSKSHNLLLYRGPMTGRWFDAGFTSVHPGQEPVKHTEPQLDVVGDGTITVRLSPDPHIEWWFAHESVSAMGYPAPLNEWPVLVPPPSLSGEFTTRAGPDGPPDIPPRRHFRAGASRLMGPVEIGDRSDPLDEIRFYLVNFQVFFLTDDILRNGERDQCAGIRLRVNNWRVEIERRTDFPQVMNHLQFQRGYGILHNCRLWREREDGSPDNFSVDDAEPVLEAVTLYASFVRGGMVGLALPVGYKDKKSSIEKWHVSAVDPGRYPDPHRPWPLPGWYPLYRPPGYENPHPGTWLVPLFEGFATKFLHQEPESRQFWQSMFRELVYTYTDAERQDKERSIVPVCTALEMLGWSILVVQQKWLTGNRHPDRGRGGYERLTAADRLRLLLKWAGLATEIPAQMTNMLAKVAESDGRPDSAELIAWTRNRVVHPDKHDQLPDGLAPETWMVAMWYTELIVLKLLGYDGYYRNRLNNEAVERVPWATC